MFSYHFLIIHLFSCCIMLVTVVRPITYECEAWTIREHLHKCVEAFEMWDYRFSLRITWVDRTLKEEPATHRKKGREPYWPSNTKKLIILDRSLDVIDASCYSYFWWKYCWKEKRLDNIKKWTQVQAILINCLNSCPFLNVIYILMLYYTARR